MNRKPEKTVECRDCGGPMPAREKRIRNVCNAPGEFPYCSRSCAEHAYWHRDLPAELDEFDKRLARAKEAEPARDPRVPAHCVCGGSWVEKPLPERMAGGRKRVMTHLTVCDRCGQRQPFPINTWPESPTDQT